MTERLSTLDASFLSLDKSSAHLHFAGLAIFDPATGEDGCLEFEEFQKLMSSRMHLVPRLRQRLADVPLGLGRPVWVDDPDFDLEFHLTHVTLPSPGGPTQLAHVVERVHSLPLDRSKPLWKTYLIDGLEGGFVATLSKVHHAMVDGLAGMYLAGHFLDPTPEPKRIEPEEWRPHSPSSGLGLVRDVLVEGITDPLRGVADIGRSVAASARDVATRAERFVAGTLSLAATGLASHGPFNLDVGPRRRFAMANVEVSEAKDVARALGGTVNDVVLVLVAEALHRLFFSRKDFTQTDLRAMVPVSVRAESQQAELGNHVSVGLVDLPVGSMSLIARFREIKRRTKDFKSSPGTFALPSLVDLGRWVPWGIYERVANLFSRQQLFNLVVSNIPGPQEPLYLNGARLIAYYPVMPLSETVGLSVAVTSLAGVMGFGVVGDWDALEDIDELTNGLTASFDDLRKAASK
jgi:diacylglycerol O-acyltransferase